MSGRATPWTLKTVRDRCEIDSEDAHGCWVWLHAGKGKKNVPQACIEGRATLVARWIMQHLGHNIAGQAVVHRCCEPRCLNPGHLNLLTKSQVLAAAYRTGLRSTEAEHFSRRRRAERSGLAKLDMPAARVLRQRLAAGETIAALSLETGLWPSTISAVKHGRSWRETQLAASVFGWGR